HVIDANVRTGLCKGAGERVKRFNWHAAIISMHIRIGLHGAVAALVVHSGDNVPVGVGRGAKGGCAWIVLSAVPHVVVDIETAFGPATVWIRSHEQRIGGTGHETSSE